MIYKSLQELFENGVCEQDDLFFLKQYANYSNDERDILIRYENNSFLIEKILEIFKDFPLQSDYEEVQFLIEIRKWVHKHLCRNGTSPLNDFDIGNWNSLVVLRKMEETPFACDCGTYSMVLTEILLSLGFRARWVQCLPMDLRFEECHSVVQIFSNKMNKWFVLDPALNCCYFNKNGTLLDLSEMRVALINNEYIVIPKCPIKRRNLIVDYWTKNIFRFRCLDYYGFNFVGEEYKKFLYLHPENYVISNKYYKKNSHLYFYNEKSFWKN